MRKKTRAAMRPKYPNGLMEAMERAGKRPPELADALGTNRQTISRWAKGERKLTVEVAERLAPLLGTTRARLMFGGDLDVRSEDVAALLDRPPSKRMVKLKGYVGAGSEAHFYALSDEDFDEVEAPPGATDQTVAVEIRGTSLGTLLNTWLVFYDDVRSPVSDDMIGRVCVVGLADDRILIKQIQRSNGGFRLVSNSASIPPIEDAKIEWAARVIAMKPRD